MTKSSNSTIYIYLSIEVVLNKCNNSKVEFPFDNFEPIKNKLKK